MKCYWPGWDDDCDDCRDGCEGGWSPGVSGAGSGIDSGIPCTSKQPWPNMEELSVIAMAFVFV